jgi:hypothetical protein
LCGSGKVCTTRRWSQQGLTTAQRAGLSSRDSCLPACAPGRGPSGIPVRWVHPSTGHPSPHGRPPGTLKVPPNPTLTYFGHRGQSNGAQKTQLCIPASPHPRTGTPASAMCYFLMPPLSPAPPGAPPAARAHHRIPANSAGIDCRIPAPPHLQIRNRRRAAVAGGAGGGRRKDGAAVRG